MWWGAAIDVVMAEYLDQRKEQESIRRIHAQQQQVQMASVYSNINPNLASSWPPMRPVIFEGVVQHQQPINLTKKQLKEQAKNLARHEAYLTERRLASEEVKLETDRLRSIAERHKKKQAARDAWADSTYRNINSELFDPWRIMLERNGWTYMRIER